MHEVVKRLKEIISKSNVMVYQQQNDNVADKPSPDSVENSLYEGSSLEFNFHNMNINEVNSTTTNELMANKNISSEKNLSKVVSEIVAFISKTNNEVELSNQKIIYYFYDHNIIQKKF